MTQTKLQIIEQAALQERYNTVHDLSASTLLDSPRVESTAVLMEPQEMETAPETKNFVINLPGTSANPTTPAPNNDDNVKKWIRIGWLSLAALFLLINGVGMFNKKKA